MSNRAHFVSWSSWMHFNVMRHMRAACDRADTVRFYRGAFLAQYLLDRMSRNDD